MANALQRLMIAASFTGLAACTNNVVSQKDSVCESTGDGVQITDVVTGKAIYRLGEYREQKSNYEWGTLIKVNPETGAEEYMPEQGFNVYLDSTTQDIKECAVGGDSPDELTYYKPRLQEPGVR